MFDPKLILQDFPILNKKVHGKRLVYLDNGATSQKPRQVIDAMTEYYQEHNANVHRGIHQLGDESTKLFHHARETVASFFGASTEELLIVRNTTEAMNQVAYTWGEQHIHEGDVILTTEMEHHSNIVPWQELARRRGAALEYITVLPDGTLDQEDFHFKVRKLPVKLLCVTHVSNALGTCNPVAEMIKFVRKNRPETKVIIDGAQGAPHLPVNFHSLDADFYAMSAHKMLGPMGVGGLLVKREILTTLPPFLFGGGMISEVTKEKTIFADDLEERFTPGTPDVASLVGWAAACEYLNKIGMEHALDHDQKLVEYALKKFANISQLHVVGPQTQRVGSVTFIYNGVHAHDVGQVLDSEGVAIRSGHHCTMPLHVKFGWPATVRVSFQLYNTTEDIDVCIAALQKVQKIFGK